MQNTLRLGMIGAGFVAKFHARAIMQVRNIEIAGVVARTAASAQSFSKMIQDHGLGEGTVYSDVAELANYRNMLTIIRDRVSDGVKKNMTLQQIQAEGLTKDYDGRYGSKTGAWSTSRSPLCRVTTDFSRGYGRFSPKGNVEFSPSINVRGQP